MYDIIVIGTGPAGVSAALYAVRGGAHVLALTHGGSSMLKAGAIENYYGLAEPLSGSQLYELGLAQLRRLQVEVKDEEVLDLTYDEAFSVQTNAGKYQGSAVIMATGSARRMLPVPGLKELEGHGISYCAVCDGFFFRKKKVAVLGNAEFALHEAAVLEPLASSVVLLTDGNPAPQTKLQVNTQKISAFKGTDHLTSVEFADGSSEEFDGLFVAMGTADTNALARKLGLIIENNYLSVDKEMHTNIPGVFAAGDCIGGLNQISTAVGEGAIAGMEALKFMRSLKK
jgi:thioredoxin reductase (NADPH)